MSIDLSLQIYTGKEWREVVEVGNYTHNCQGMWAKALEAAGFTVEYVVAEYYRKRAFISLCSLNEMPAEQAIPFLKSAIAHMDDPANEAEYEAMNPPNGWGKFDSAREYLRKLLVACEENPACRIYASC